MSNLRASSLLLLSMPGLALSLPTAAVAQSASTAVSPDLSPQPAADEGSDANEIVVSARLRKETLISTPVTVAALSGKDIVQYNTDSFAKVAELVPGLAVGNMRGGGGGSIAIRGIGTSVEQTGGDQAVTTAIDGLMVNSGRLSILGFFDLAQVEVLKGPQALLFGKNSAAGVVALTSAGSTDRFEAHVRAGYEFVADERYGEVAFSGPLTPTLGARLALRARESSGWIYNDARARNNPFFPSIPYADPEIKRFGDREILGRLTLEYRPSSDLTAVLKVFGDSSRDSGSMAYLQNVGCVRAQPFIFGVLDTQGECTRDNHATAGQVPAAFVKDYSDGNGGKPFGKLDAVMSTLRIDANLGMGTLTSISGFSKYKSLYGGAPDANSFTQVFVTEKSQQTTYSEELRFLTKLDGPLNFMVGAYFQHVNETLHKFATIRQDLNYNPATGSYIAFETLPVLTGKTYSVFGQAIYAPNSSWEIAGGLRWTHEDKHFNQHQGYGFGSGFATNYDVSGDFSDSNLSPEVTVSWHPDRFSTIYAAYKTGYKSGGFGAGSILRAGQGIAFLNYGSEHVKGFELGAKAELFDRKVRILASAFRYHFKDLQVTTFNPVIIALAYSNAAGLKQYGFDLQLQVQPTNNFQLRGAVVWSHNRYETYNGQCYTGQTAVLGCNILPGPLQDLSGRAPARSPDWSGNIGFTYDIDLPRGMKVSVGSDAFFSDGYFAGDTFSPLSYQSSFWRVNANIRLSGEDDRWEVALTGRNLTNEYYVTTAADRVGGIGDQRGNVGRGRQVALEGAIKF